MDRLNLCAALLKDAASDQVNEERLTSLEKQLLVALQGCAGWVALQEQTKQRMLASESDRGCKIIIQTVAAIESAKSIADAKSCIETLDKLRSNSYAVT